MRTYCIDIDGTICTNTGGTYLLAEPFGGRIAYINQLKREGNKVILFTARGSSTGIDWGPATENQLESWGVTYDSLILGKPFFDVLVDDKAIAPLDFFND